MNEEDDPYEVLAVARDASQSDIKKAYRQLALRHHPDKQTTEEDRQQATHLFVKISNAYEVLSDPQKRQEYDMGGPRRRHDPTDFDQGVGTGAMPHDFFRRNSFHFHDPFEVFNQVFREEFARHNTAARSASGLGGSFHDPFFASPFSSMMSSRSSFFDQDPFFGGMGGRGTSGRGVDPFFSSFGGGMGGGPDPFAMMQQSMLNGNMNNSSSFVQTISSNGGMGSSSVSTSTTTRIVNGTRQTVTETVIQKPDGTIERRVHSDGDGNMGSRSTRMIDQESDNSALPRRQLLGPRRRSTSSSTQPRPDGQQQQEQHQRSLEAAPERKKQKKRWL